MIDDIFKGFLQRALAKLKQRLAWRTSRSRYARLTVVSQFFPPDFAATGQLLDDLTARLASDSLQVQVLTGMPAYAYSTTSAERITFQANRCIRRTRVSRIWPQRIRGRAMNGLLFCGPIALRLMRYARRGDLLLYTTEPAYLPLLGALIHRITRTPYLILLYDLYPDVLIELGVLPERHWLVRLWRRWNRWAFAKAEALIVLSDAMADRVRSIVPEVASKLEVIPSWADPQQIQPLAKSENPFVAAHGLQNTFTVLYSGNQGRCHDLITMLAAALLLRHEAQIRFLLIGGGAQEPRLRALVQEWGLTNCSFLPYQEREALPHSLASADLAVVSLGIEAEGLVAPSKLYGHLAAGTPIAAITPAHSYLATLVETEGCGRWFANGDAEGLSRWILALRHQPSLAAHCGAASRQLLERTASTELVIAAYWTLIRRHLPEGKLPPARVPRQPRGQAPTTRVSAA